MKWTMRRVYSENEYEREGRNGRIYRGVLGWRWYIYCGAEQIGDPLGYSTRREAHEAGMRILNN